jgi:SpoVK/Ycf46/Vps4 family AAA+-type ATPase
MGNKPAPQTIDQQITEDILREVEVARQQQERQERYHCYQQAVKWDKNVIGQREAKQALEYSFFLPRRFPSYFKLSTADDSSRKYPNRLILLWGPPGTGDLKI